MFVNMPFNNEGRILIKNLYILKGYTASVRSAWIVKSMSVSLCRYNVMKLCWDRQPYNRPDFSELTVFFGNILDASVKMVGLSLVSDFCGGDCAMLYEVSLCL